MTVRLRRPLVLVADDDRDTRELYRACFDTSGYRTAEAETGPAALAVATELLPDVLLTDFRLPELDGLAIAHRLKNDSRTAGIRIVLVTGFSSPHVERRAADVGIERVLRKPALPQAVMHEVAHLLGHTIPTRALRMTLPSQRVFGRLD